MHSQRPLWPQPDVQSYIVQTTKGPVDVLESGDGRPILYFHGMGAGNEIVPPLERALVDDGFRLIVPNRPGYYGTPLTSGRTPSDCADLAAELLDHLGIERAAVMGTSGGGLAASSFAARHAARTVLLLLQCAVCHPFSSPRWMPPKLQWLYPLLRHHRVFGPLLRLGYRWEMRRFRRHPERIVSDMSGDRYPEIRRSPATQALVRLLSESVRRCAQEPSGTENDAINLVGEPWLIRNSVSCPTMIAHDRADPLVPFRHAEWGLHCIPGAVLCEVRCGGHLIGVGKDVRRMHEQRAAFLQCHFEQAEETRKGR